MTTADAETVRGLIRGAYDMHVHSAPDVLPRRFDDLVMAQHALDAGMAGFVIKNHYAPTAGRAADIRAAVPGVNAYGGLVLNNSVGGLNPIAVDIAGRMGNKVVWMPTVDAANELDNIAGGLDESKLPYWMTIARAMRERGIAGEPIRVVDGDGKVRIVVSKRDPGVQNWIDTEGRGYASLTYRWIWTEDQPAPTTTPITPIRCRCASVTGWCSSSGRRHCTQRRSAAKPRSATNFDGSSQTATMPRPMRCRTMGCGG